MTTDLMVLSCPSNLSGFTVLYMSPYSVGWGKMARGKINYHGIGVTQTLMEIIKNKHTLLKDVTPDWLASLMALS